MVERHPKIREDAGQVPLDVEALLAEMETASPGYESDPMRLLLSRVTLDNGFQFQGLCDLQGNIWEANHTALVGAGLVRSDIHGKPFWHARWWQSSEAAQKDLEAGIRRAAKGEFVRYDTVIYGGEGGTQTIVIDFSIRPALDSGGQPRFLVVEGRDVTEQRRLERAVEEQRQQLAEAVERLKEVDRFKSQMFANVSHEFRTPLTLILGPLEDALRDPAKALQAGALESVHRNALRLLRLVNTVLDFSRIEAGRLDASYEPTDLAAYTAEVASGFRSAIEKAGLTFHVDCPTLPEQVHVDREMWEKIVLNLLSNAFKHTFDGWIRVTLRHEKDVVTLTVDDAGVGIPESEISRITERFHRVKDARSRTHEGTGIGLALVKEFAAAHGGTLSIASREGEGSSFSVTVRTGTAHLPAERIGAVRTRASTATGANAYAEEALRWISEEEAAEARFPHSARQREQDVSPESTATGAGHQPRPRILWADDNADMRDYVRRLLSEQYEVTVCGDGAAALASALANPPDLVLTDIMMPGVDGFALLKALREDQRTCTIPVVLVSARAGRESSVEGMEAGADDYLVKPFSARELLARVHTHLHLASLRRGAMAVLEREAEARRYAALHASEERVRAHAKVLDFAQVIVRDMEHRIVLWNRAAEELYGFAQEEAVGQISHTLLRTEFPEPLPRIQEELLETGAWKGELVHHAKGWGRIVVTSNWSLHYTNGKPANIVETYTDVTALKKTEAALAQAQKIQALGTLAGGIAHDFNNILTAIAGYVELLSEDLPAGDGSHEYVGEIRAASERAARLVRQILTFSRREEPERKVIRLQPVIEEALDLLRASIPAMIEIHSNFDPTTPNVSADATQIHQIVMNLGTNAAHAIGSSGGLIEVTLMPVPLDRDQAQASGGLKAGRYVRLSIRDNGSGMDSGILERIFDPFFTTKAPGKGTGLGLAVVHGIVAAHGGGINVNSEPGKGTVFHLLFPATRAVAVSEAALQPTTPRGSGQRILCVDDERAVLAVMTRSLERLGYQVSSYSEPSDALNEFRARPEAFNLIVTDLGLRGMSGLDFAREVLRIRPGMPVLVASGHFGAEDQERAKQLGVSDFIFKPMKPTELGGKVSRFLKG